LQGLEKSNLTLSGQMLEALDYKSTSKGFTVFVKNTKRSKIGNEKKTITNDKVAEYVSKQGRPFLALTKSEQNILSRSFQRLLRELARRVVK
jgi:hypothetical protein